MTRPVRVALALAAALAAVPAEARPRGGGRGGSYGYGGTEMVSVWGVFDPGPIDGLGAGFRVMVPIASQGILQGGLRDELTLELGADVLHYEDRVGLPPDTVSYSWNGILAVAGVTWNLWLTPRFALYPKLETGWWFGWYRGWNDQFGYTRADFDGLFLQGALGLILRADTFSFRLEAGSGLLRIGAGFAF